jgi:hypothetical protein
MIGSNQTKQKISKADAIRREIDMAIKLLFFNEDPIGIHLIVAAAFRLVCDLSNKNSDSFINEHLDALIKPERKNEFFKITNRYVNFFKHADKDPYAVLEEFDEELSDILLFLNCFAYQDLGCSPTKRMNLYILWFSALNPEFLKPDSSFDSIFGSDIFSAVHSSTRQDKIEIGASIFKNQNL